MAKKQLPEWLPFALVASALVAVGAGIRSGWKTSSSSKPAPQPIQQAGVLRDWTIGARRA